MEKQESNISRNRKAELLAPAGNAEGFYGAIHAGADAVYLAGDKFGARAYAENFTTETLVECIRYAHLLGRKVYLTVNTLLKEGELSGLYDYLCPFYEAGLDAVIVQDLGVFRFIREHFPGLKLHVSTQMTLCSSYGASLLKEMGASRIVPARELSLKELAAMKQQADIEIEAFIHGAMCYCYSGQCLFSSILGGRSGNRGRCAQPCRLPYSVSTGGAFGKECYPLSLKDMCTIEHIPQLIEAGIDSFKIEGRMKKPEYTAGVTAIYRRYIDLYYSSLNAESIISQALIAALPAENSRPVSAKGDKERRLETKDTAKSYHIKKADLELLKSLYIRSEIQDGYYFRHNGQEMITLESPAYKGSDEQKLSEIREKYIAAKEKLPVHIKAVFQVGHPAEVIYTWQEQNSRVTGNQVEQAGRQPVTSENIRKQLGKLGDSSFYVEEMEITADPDCFYPLKQINELRRAAIAGLEELVLAARGYSKVSSGRRAAQADILQEGTAAQEVEVLQAETATQQDEIPQEEIAAKEEADAVCCQKNSNLLPCRTPGTNSLESNTFVLSSSGQKWAAYGYSFSVSTLPQLEAAADWFSACFNERSRVPLRFYIEGDLFLQERAAVLSACKRLPTGSSLYLALPYILRESDRHYLEQLQAARQESGMFCGFLVRSMDGLGFVRGLAEPVCCRADAGVYAWNQQAVRELASLTEGFCLPYELNEREQKGLPEGLSCEKIVYGRIPMMLTANCLFRSLGQCRKNGEQQHKPAIIKDRYHKNFPVAANCLHCMNIIYNSVPLSLYQSLSRWKGSADLRMDFTLESPKEVKALLDAFLNGAPFPMGEYTTGHEKRGVE